MALLIVHLIQPNYIQRNHITRHQQIQKRTLIGPQKRPLIHKTHPLTQQQNPKTSIKFIVQKGNPL